MMRKLKSLSMPCTALVFSKALNAKYRSSEFGGQAYERIVGHAEKCSEQKASLLSGIIGSCPGTERVWRV
jgi:hypothetical protein